MTLVSRENMPSNRGWLLGLSSLTPVAPLPRPFGRCQRRRLANLLLAKTRIYQNAIYIIAYNDWCIINALYNIANGQYNMETGQRCTHYTDVIMGAIASQITCLTIVYLTVYSDADQRKQLLVTGLCVGNSPVTGEFPAQMASNAENVSIWLRHHVYTSMLSMLDCYRFNLLGPSDAYMRQ